MASAAAVFAAGPAHADYVSSVRAQLRAQGYRQISVSETLLGRSRILATGKGGTREIIMNPRTGEILRDLWISSNGESGPSIGGSEGASDKSGKAKGDGKNKNENENENENEDGEKEDASDNSGHGSGGDKESDNEGKDGGSEDGGKDDGGSDDD